jgi:hypothetical protein
MYHQTETTIADLTQGLVQQFVALKAAPGERKLKEQRVQWLTNLVVNGGFYTPKWAKATLDGVEYRVNGQHSSMALYRLNGELPVDMKVVIDSFHCDSEDDLAELFLQFDNDKSKRSSQEKVIAYNSVGADVSDMPVTNIRKAIDGVAFCLEEDGKFPRYDQDAKSRLILSRRQYLGWAKEFMGQRAVRNRGVSGAIYATYSVAGLIVASTFWKLVFGETASDANDATRVLARFLRDSQGNNTGKIRFNQRACFVKCCHAWNAWRKNQTTRLNYQADKPWPDLVQ